MHHGEWACWGQGTRMVSTAAGAGGGMPAVQRCPSRCVALRRLAAAGSELSAARSSPPNRDPPPVCVSPVTRAQHARSSDAVNGLRRSHGAVMTRAACITVSGPAGNSGLGGPTAAGSAGAGGGMPVVKRCPSPPPRRVALRRLAAAGCERGAS